MTCPRPHCWAHKPTIFIPSYWAFLSPTLQSPVNPKMREAADALGKERGITASLGIPIQIAGYGETTMAAVLGVWG